MRWLAVLKMEFPSSNRSSTALARKGKDYLLERHAVLSPVTYSLPQSLTGQGRGEIWRLDFHKLESSPE